MATTNLAEKAPITGLLAISKQRANAASRAGDLFLANRLAGEIVRVEQLGKISLWEMFDTFSTGFAVAFGFSVWRHSSLERVLVVACTTGLVMVLGHLTLFHCTVEAQQRNVLRRSLLT